MKKLGMAVKIYRKSLKMTQKEFAILYDVSSDSVARWEHGETRPPMKLLNKLFK